jgi:mono/diheme cytochrome c family protein
MLTVRIETHGSSMARNRLISAVTDARTRRTRWIALVMVTVGLSACTAEAPPAVSIDDPELVRGREVYARSCASCHGASGGGGVGLQLSEGAVIEAFPDIEDQLTMVAEGRNNMPAFGDRLSIEDQRAVARYTREVLD